MARRIEGENRRSHFRRRDVLTHERLRALLHYDRETGVWVWRVKHFMHEPGARAGHLMTLGYWLIGVDGRQYLSHRLAWFYVTEEWPRGQIDHKNTIKGDDAFDNLRVATKSQNMCNRGLQKNNTTGAVGVRKFGDKFQARYKRDGRTIHLGTFATFDLAKEARARAIAYRGEFQFLGGLNGIAN